MDVLFEFSNIDNKKMKKLAESESLSAFFDRVAIGGAVMSQRIGYGESQISGLVESYGLRGGWTIGIAGSGDLSDILEWFSGRATMKIEPAVSGLYVRLDGGSVTAAALIEAVGRAVQILSVQSAATTTFYTGGGIPVEMYYRPPLSYYDNFQLSQMDGDTLFQLERQLIE
nr:MAG TPA: hypothetical protein [Caudoviricetes sp.]